MNKPATNPASFRDPSGFVFTSGGQVYRQVNQSYKKNYVLLMSSGLFDKLIKQQLLIPHTEIEIEPPQKDIAYKIIKPTQLGFISYPYEYCFSQLKDAALATIEILQIALEHGMILKDASAYNIQFVEGIPQLIDTLSFDEYTEGQIWIGYRQFCQHFLAPLALMVHCDIRLNQMLQLYIDGIPLDIASKLLPKRTKFNFSLLTHIHLHAKSQKRYAGKEINSSKKQMSHQSLLGLIDNLKSAVLKLNWTQSSTEWGDYYDETNYTEAGLAHKKEIVSNYLAELKPNQVWDLGGNTGQFSRLASDSKIPTISFDIDPLAVEKNYQLVKKNSESNILPLILDLTNPSASIGWANKERLSIAERAPSDTVMALALIHHLAISNNLPLELIASFFSSITKKGLIIEFIPKSDSQVQRLLASREDIFDKYSQDDFESAFGQFFNLSKSTPVKDSDRTVYLYTKSIK